MVALDSSDHRRQSASSTRRRPGTTSLPPPPWPTTSPTWTRRTSGRLSPPTTITSTTGTAAPWCIIVAQTQRTACRSRSRPRPRGTRRRSVSPSGPPPLCRIMTAATSSGCLRTSTCSGGGAEQEGRRCWRAPGGRSRAATSHACATPSGARPDSSAS